MAKMSKSKQKHPRNMTTDAALSHLFHPKALKHVSKEVEAAGRKKRSTKE
jgi:hypothetical protein